MSDTYLSTISTQADGDSKDDFDSIMNSAWFVLVTLSTVGYGDSTPSTDAGHVIAAAAIVAGVLFMSMPLAIVGNNFVTVCSEKRTLTPQQNFNPPKQKIQPPQKKLQFNQNRETIKLQQYKTKS